MPPRWRVKLFISHKLPVYFLNSSRCPLFTAMHFCKPVCQLQYAPLCMSTSTAQPVSNGLFVFLNCHSTAVLTVCQEPHREISVQWGLATERSELCLRNYEYSNTVLHVPTLHCDWPYEMPSSPPQSPLIEIICGDYLLHGAESFRSKSVLS